MMLDDKRLEGSTALSAGRVISARSCLTPRVGMLAVLLLAGCSMSPSQNILGSFFPSWMLCAVIGIIAAVALRLLFGAIGLERHVLSPPLTYFSVAVAVTLGAWLIQFGQ